MMISEEPKFYLVPTSRGITHLFKNTGISACGRKNIGRINAQALPIARESYVEDTTNNVCKACKNVTERAFDKWLEQFPIDDGGFIHFESEYFDLL